MSPTIDIDDDVMNYLKSQAEPFVDTPSSVLRRLLDLNGGPARPTPNAPAPERRTRVTNAPDTQRKASKRPAGRNKATVRTRAPSGSLLPEEAYVVPLLRALDAAGGEAPYRTVLDAVGRELESALMPADFEELSSGGIRWHSRLQFVRLRLIERGDMDREAPRGIWRLTAAGRETLNGDSNR